MGTYSYSEFFQKFPHIYSAFHKVVNHSENFTNELVINNLLLGTKSLLSIGSGEGELEINLAIKHGLKLGIVEPVSEYIQLINNTINNHDLKNMILEIFNGTFQKFQSSHLYDLIISIHSWYALGENNEELQQALNYRSPKGRLFIALITSDSLIQKIALTSSNRAGENLTAERLSTWAKKNGYEHKYWTNYKKIHVSELVNNSGELTFPGQSLISFPSFTPWEEIPEKLKVQCKGLMEDHIENDHLILKNGCLLF